MARQQIQTDEQRLLSAAARLIGAGPGDLAVVIVRGQLLAFHEAPPAVESGQVPEGMGDYDAAIVRAVSDNAVSAARLARTAGHRHNSYFRERLAALVEAGYIRHTRQGYRLPGG
ncbi:MAG: hypothetical protein ACRELF_11305 [Gemmataceae bacterium]